MQQLEFSFADYLADEKTEEYRLPFDATPQPDALEEAHKLIHDLEEENNRLRCLLLEMMSAPAK